MFRPKLGHVTNKVEVFQGTKLFAMLKSTRTRRYNLNLAPSEALASPGTVDCWASSAGTLDSVAISPGTADGLARSHLTSDYLASFL